MFKKILSIVLALAIFAVVPVMIGCEQDEKTIERKTNVTVPAGQPKTVVN